MELDLLNHACIKISFQNGTKILFDPWLDGYAFDDGWGLKYNNPDALDCVKDCNYLWISHWHTDHFHIPTLKKILQVNPEITLFENNSYNFQFDAVLKKLGFKNIIPLYERNRIKIKSNLWIERYPTTGIDNMLFIKSEEGNLLNYNDCNIPVYTRNRLFKKLDKIDILLNNFNHAGKLFDFPLPNDKEIKIRLKNNFKSTIKSFQPKYTIPFASSHYYRAPENIAQNSSLMDSTNLIEIDSSVIPLKVGDKIIFNDSFTDYKIKSSENIILNKTDLKVRDQIYSIEELKEASKLYCKKINNGFMQFTFWIPPLLVKVTDLDIIISLKMSKKEFSIVNSDEQFHISSTSQELWTWWNKPYGTDSFIVAGPFTLNSGKQFPLRVILLFGLLTENKLDLKSLFKMLFNVKGIVFLFNRREEILGLIFSGKFIIGMRN